MISLFTVEVRCGVWWAAQCSGVERGVAAVYSRTRNTGGNFLSGFLAGLANPFIQSATNKFYLTINQEEISGWFAGTAVRRRFEGQAGAVTPCCNSYQHQTDAL